MSVSGPPVFVGGMQRSGTSMVRAMLGSSPDLAMYDNDWSLLSELADAFGGPVAARSARYRKLLLAEVLFHPKALSSPTLMARAGVIAKATMAGELDTYDDLARFALDQFRDERGRPRVGLKEPGLERHVDNLDRMFGDHRFIHLVRDPLASYLSAQAYGIQQSPERWSDEWRRSVEGGEARAGDTYLMVRYEDIVADRQAWATRFAEFCELAWSDEITTGLAQPGWGGRNSSFGSDEERPSLSDDVTARLVAVAGDALVRWGYTPEEAPAAPRGIEVRVMLARGEQRLRDERRRLRRAVAARLGPR